MTFTAIDDSHPVFGGAGFAPIPGLKVGERVRWRCEALKAKVLPGLDESTTVYRVFDPPRQAIAEVDTGDAPSRIDFSALYLTDCGRVMEMFHDSRRFERV